jgi:thioredoxin-like negative regulator of GroEL
LDGAEMTKWILFSGKHCKNCEPMKRNLDTVGIKYDEVSTDTDKGKMMSGVMHVRSLPTLVITLHGKPVHSFVGYLPIEKLDEIKKKFK